MRAALCTLALLAAMPVRAETAPTFPTEAELRARYTLPASRFATIAGEEIHYADEGKGPAILLLHGSYASLRQWDFWAKALSRHYRVIRFDHAPQGLSSANPSGDYTLDHHLAVIDGLMNRLKINRFVIVGTSSGGLPATAYAATRPQRIRGVVLNNIAVGPVKFDLSALPAPLQAAVAEDRTHPGWHRPEYWRQILLANIEDDSRVTPALAQEWTDLNHRAMRDPAIGKAVLATMTPFSRSGTDLAAIAAPTLFLWSADDHETTLEGQGMASFAASASRDKALEVVPACGHMMPLDCPERALERTLPFLKRVLGR